jgi:RHS repeat-associated protein
LQKYNKKWHNNDYSEKTYTIACVKFDSEEYFLILLLTLKLCSSQIIITESETGLDYRGARFYDGDLGRFLSLDPHAADYPSLSAYVYVADNPLIFIDPDGRDAILIVFPDYMVYCNLPG